MKDLELKRALLSCPGDTIQEHLDAIGMSQKELAERMGRSVPKVNEIIKGKTPITKDTASRLEYVLHVPAGFWLNLERHYQEELLEIERMEELEKTENWISGFPLPDLKKLGIIPNTRNKISISESLLKFFRVASPGEWSSIYKDSSLVFKIELKHTIHAKAVSVWLRYGEIQAEKMKVAPFDKGKLRTHLEDFQDISYRNAYHWLDELQDLCTTCGIALVYTPGIAKAPIYGATRWIKNKSLPLIQITDRRKDYHAFWFTFYHELAHIIYHGKKDIFIEGLDSIKNDEQKEAEADEFAAKQLLSPRQRKEVFQHQNWDSKIVLELSEKLKKHPGIIVGQIQRKDQSLYKDPQLNKLKAKVDFNRESVLL